MLSLISLSIQTAFATAQLPLKYYLHCIQGVTSRHHGQILCDTPVIIMSHHVHLIAQCSSHPWFCNCSPHGAILHLGYRAPRSTANHTRPRSIGCRESSQNKVGSQPCLSQDFTIRLQGNNLTQAWWYRKYTVFIPRFPEILWKQRCRKVIKLSCAIVSIPTYWHKTLPQNTGPYRDTCEISTLLDAGLSPW